MTRKSRLLILLLCALLALMLSLHALHAAHHLHGHSHDHDHAHANCTVCSILEGWLSLLRRVLSQPGALAGALILILTALAMTATVPALLPHITPVSLKVKITS